MAPKHSTLNGQRFIRYRGNAFTSRTNRLTGHKGTRVPRYTVMSNHITGLHLVTLTYEMAVITITRWEIRTPYQAPDSDSSFELSLITSSYAHHTGPMHV